MSKLAVLTTYFTPFPCKYRKKNFDIFKQNLSEECDLFVVEISFNGLPFVTNGDIQIKGKPENLMWQKERLINLLLDQVSSKEYENVAFVDCDVLFGNTKWVSECNQLLEKANMVQLFSEVQYLNEQGQVDTTAESFGSGLKRGYFDFNTNLNPGFAWAFKTDLIKSVGFYDRMIVGGFDSILTLASFGMVNARVMNSFSPYLSLDIISWVNKFSSIFEGKVSCVDGVIQHLFHGELKKRQYSKRRLILKHNNYNPHLDLRLDDNGLYLFTLHGQLCNDIKQYFINRI